MQRNNDLPALTGLRFFAAAGIFIHHSDKGVFFEGDLFAPISFASGVPLFFALSGFVLAINAAKYKDIPAFFVARAARVWPAHLATIVLLMAAFWPYSTMLLKSPHLGDSLLNVLLLQSWSWNQNTFMSLNAPAWSVSCELFFYAVFPLLIVWLASNAAAKALSMFAVAMGGCALFGLIAPNHDGVMATWVGYINPVVNLPTFAFGVAAGLWFRGNREAASKNATVIQVAFLVLLFAVMLFCGYIAAGYNSALSRFVAISGPAPLFALLLVVLARYPLGAISRSLALPVFVYLGEISYSIYLVHQIVFRWWSDRKAQFADYSIWEQYMGAIAVTLFISALIYHLIEKPARSAIIGLWRSTLRRRLASS